ncbi:MAG: hypothetical protein KF739_00860 [Cryobacterium sp.]|nr:hypothetical protein [Micrococcales bacterium]MBX3308968.1 hypothetical protein [Cryobacterium sp.]
MDMHADMDAHMDMDMDMPMPGGIPLASGGPDRDGLEMDVLHVALGPVLPHWPAGLVVRCALKGDVIVHAEVEILPAAPGTALDNPARVGRLPSADDDRRRTVIHHSDAAVQLLALVGWWSAAGRARRIRDEVASGTALAEVAPRLERLAKDVKRSRLLGWGLKGIAADTGPGVQRAGNGDAATARTRLLHWLNEAGRIARDTADSYEPLDFADRQRESLGAIPSLVNGTDVASARLIIASLAIDTSALTTSGEARS